MNPEREIVKVWLNRQGFFTISDINAGSRVIDVLAIKQGSSPKIAHIEVACSITGAVTDKVKDDIGKKFTSGSVVRKVAKTIKEHIGAEGEYERFLITTVPNLKIDGVNVISFDKILFEVVNELDTQKYDHGIVRTLQLVKFILLSNPAYIAKLIGKEKDYRALTYSGREMFIRNLFEQDVAKKIFNKRDNEQILIELLKNSTLRQPERLAAALDSILTKRTATKFLNTLLKQKQIKTAIRHEAKDRPLMQFIEG